MLALNVEVRMVLLTAEDLVDSEGEGIVQHAGKKLLQYGRRLLDARISIYFN
jgi:hypothetical protein